MTEPAASGSVAEPVRALRHALRTPVNHIVGYGELLLEDAEAAGRETLVAGLQEIVAAGRKALALIDEIVGSAAAGAGAPEPSRAGEALLALAGQIGSRSAALLAGMPADAAAAADLHKIAAAAQDLAALVAQQVPSLARSAQSEPGAARATVLVVDDNELNREMLARRVQRLGHRVLEAENGRQALEIMRARAVDVALLDIMMPELDGYGVLEQRYGDPRLREIPVIMISAVDEIESVARCITLGAEDYLPKPFNPVLLKARLDASLERKRRHDVELATLRDVQRLTEAAAAVESGTFAPDELADLAARGDPLGRLAHVLVSMAGAVKDREQRLQSELQQRSYVFLSYARRDKDQVERLLEALHEADIRVWVDRHDIAPGSAWSGQIVQSIRGCAALLIACTPDAMASRNVRQEIQLAWKYNRPYVPLILQPTQFPDDVEYQLEGCQWVDVMDRPARVWLPPLLQALARLGVAVDAS